MTTMDDETEASVLAGLDKAMQQEPTRGVRRSHLREVLNKHQATIERALRRGHTRTALARILQDSGVPASLETIRAYLGEQPTRATKATAKTTGRAQRTKPRQPEAIQALESQEHPEATIAKIAPEPEEGNW